MEAGRIYWAAKAATREHSGDGAAQHEERTGMEALPQHECEEPGEQAQQGQAHGTIGVMVLVGRRLSFPLVGRGSAVNVISVRWAIPRSDDRHGRRGVPPVRKFVAGKPVHREDREDREERCEERHQRVDTKPMRVLPTRDHAIGL